MKIMNCEMHVRRGGVLPAIMTSLAFPDRRVLRVLLYPKVTTQNRCQSLRFLGGVIQALMIDETRRTLSAFHDKGQT